MDTLVACLTPWVSAAEGLCIYATLVRLAHYLLKARLVSCLTSRAFSRQQACTWNDGVLRQAALPPQRDCSAAALEHTQLSGM